MQTIKYRKPRILPPCAEEGCRDQRYAFSHTAYCYAHYLKRRSNLPLNPDKAHLHLLAKTGECYDDPQHEWQRPTL